MIFSPLGIAVFICQGNIPLSMYSFVYNTLPITLKNFTKLYANTVPCILKQHAVWESIEATDLANVISLTATCTSNLINVT